jgi:hypothetical protein
MYSRSVETAVISSYERLRVTLTDAYARWQQVPETFVVMKQSVPFPLRPQLRR